MGTYISQTDLETQYGTQNISEWSDLTNDSASANTTRIAQAISFAETYVEARLRGSRYAVPLTSSAYIKYICCALAAEYLYKIRGKRSVEENDVFDKELRQVDKMLNQIATGGHRIDSALSHDGPTGPAVIAY
jgi:phage gp36-like protein